MERSLLTGLLIAQQHNYTDELSRAQPPARPRTVRRVVDLIQAHPDRQYTLGELARVAGVSARRLQESFHEHVGVPPITYLRDTRLERIHAELRAGADSVSDVAHRWGFTHLGRFASSYRKRFGVHPSQTLRNGGV
ncbi:helix-turn-helix transcriptional regulator [Saccharopolyspora shandongensis]|uniref:helix-turn-helix transcriptional regulator n=1 Tax=Saccharopolyspora shandongensis TaxID=418495 RepID=UPI0033D965E6